MKYLITMAATIAIVTLLGCCHLCPPTALESSAEQTAKELELLKAKMEGLREETPTVSFEKIDGAFGFVGSIGITPSRTVLIEAAPKVPEPRFNLIPTIGRGQPFTLRVSKALLHEEEISSIELSNFRAFIGPPWAEDPHQDGSWAPKTITLAAPSIMDTGEYVEVEETLDTRCPLRWPHRLIVFNVTVNFEDGTSFTYVDPWDESPGFP